VIDKSRDFRGGCPLQMQKGGIATESGNLKEKLARRNEYWSPTIIGELNDAYVKIVKFTGEFVCHHHDNEAEMLLNERTRVELQRL
jgi:hypothetical protein